jgi:ABC-type Zn uptake system ZnuABC Zn-binding protein ZnuA
MTKARGLRRIGLASAAAVVLAACGGDDGSTSSAGGSAAANDTSAPSDERPLVVTTVAPITSIVGSIAGDRVNVVGIVPEGTNSHTFEPKPSDAEVLSQADLILVNGLVLEEPTRELAEANKPDGTHIVELGAQTITPEQYIFDFSFPEDEGKPNPHLWTNPPMAARYAAIVAEELTALDPDGAATYQANLAAFEAGIAELDAAMQTAFATIPASAKKLVTYHDGYAYFARDYGWRVVGAIQASDFEDPTPQEVASLIEQIEQEQVPAIFGSEVFPSDVLDVIADETGASYVDDLRDDDLPGAPGDVDHSWFGLMRQNFAIMTDALGGDAASLESLELPALADGAEYPQ